MAKGKFLTREEVRAEYEKRAGIYEFAVYLYYLVGFRIGRYRRLAVEAIAPRQGDTVIEIGCGTGMNFPLLREKVGPEGRIIGVDISEAMLKRAAKRIDAAGWKNVELVRSSAADYAFPEGVDGIIATGVLTYEPDYDKVIERGARALAPGKRWVVFDYKMPTGWFRRLVPLFAWISRPFGISLPLFDRTPLESIKRYLRHVKIKEFYFGLIFIASGEAS
ncbi:MAG: methyltransferase domain-containing protein [Alphaproteobacteria bacterium]|nr:methyltransferase domain-containing protein [Alphaproteobacteria bacterium]